MKFSEALKEYMDLREEGPCLSEGVTAERFRKERRERMAHLLAEMDYLIDTAHLS